MVKKFMFTTVLGLFNLLFALSGAAAENIWDKEGIPHAGWTHQSVEDLGSATGSCEMCSKERIRYLHTVDHEDYGLLTVGFVCAEKMCEDYVNPKAREAAAKKRAAAQRREEERAQLAQQRLAERLQNARADWVNVLNWDRKPTGNYSRYLAGSFITMFYKGTSWKYVYNNVFSGSFNSIAGALDASYDQYTAQIQAMIR